MRKKAFTLVEAVVAMVIFAIMAGMLFTVNANFVSNVAHGLTTTYAANQADNIQTAMKNLSLEAKNIWITPLLSPGEQEWVVSGTTSSTEVRVGDALDSRFIDAPISSLGGVSTADIVKKVDTYIYEQRPAQTNRLTSYYYNKADIKRGYLIWFNSLNSDSSSSIKGLVEVKLLGPASVSGSTVDTSAEEDAQFPRAVNSSNSIRVTLYLTADATSNIITNRATIESGLLVLDDLTPNNSYFGFRGNRVDLSYSTGTEEEGEKLVLTEDDVEDVAVTWGGVTLKPVASYVVDYLAPSDTPSPYSAIADFKPAEHALYSTVRLIDNHAGAVAIKLPHPHDRLAAKVPKTLGFVGSLWLQNTALASAQDLEIENAAMFTIYPYLSD